MGLLYGSVASDKCLWLAVGNPPGTREKLVQFHNDCTVPVHVRGNLLRANAKPQEGRLLIHCNDGTASVVVRLQVPIKPFPQGALAGALSPRQVAEKAKAAPREAVVLFENGSVAQWFKDNGWTYPVQGPAGSGFGAVQQFFEALGLVRPPRVEINQQSVRFAGNAGDSVHDALEIRTEENRAVYAHAVSSEPWLEIGKRTFAGRCVTIPLVVRAIPNRPGETLQAVVKVRANGNQAFAVAVALAVGHRAGAGAGPVPVTRTTVPASVPIDVIAVHSSPPDPVQPDVSSATPVAAFGMVRLVYWSSFIGGWSALLG